MYVVFADNTLENLDLERLAGLADEFLDLERNLPFRNLVAIPILGHEYKLVLDFEKPDDSRINSRSFLPTLAKGFQRSIRPAKAGDLGLYSGNKLLTLKLFFG